MFGRMTPLAVLAALMLPFSNPFLLTPLPLPPALLPPTPTLHTSPTLLFSSPPTPSPSSNKRTRLKRLATSALRGLKNVPSAFRALRALPPPALLRLAMSLSLLLYTFHRLLTLPNPPLLTPLSFSKFMALAAQPRGTSDVAGVMIARKGDFLQVLGKKGERYLVNTPPVAGVGISESLLAFLISKHIPFDVLSPSRSDRLSSMFGYSITLAYLSYMCKIYQTMNNPGGEKKGGVGSLFRRKAKRGGGVPEEVVTFNEIAGADAAKQSVLELLDSCVNEAAYSQFGARPPRGLLLVGPPGTGKTLLARAVANSMAIPLIQCSGSDFVEMFVGRGAKRVRDIFKKAGKYSKCIIFIDELDGIGKKRGGGMGLKSNDEAEQTLNQLLACMDGIDGGRKIIVMAATNRFDVLDEALVRPGRFDRIVRVELPNVEGRRKIFEVKVRKLPVARGVDLSVLANLTPNMSGAEIEGIVNEAAIRAVQRARRAAAGEFKREVIMEDFEDAVKEFYSSRMRVGGLGNVMSLLKPNKK